jgi:dTDP-glucose pyrophosphorylase
MGPHTLGLSSVRAGSSLREAVEVIQRTSMTICLVVDDDGRLVGSLSDGDVRRAFLAGAALDSPVDAWCGRDPQTVREGTGRASVLDLMRALGISQIPEVDAEGRVLRLHLLREIVGGGTRENVAVILAGGRGTRLREVTGDLPKPMVPVAGRPIIERLVLHLVGSGITDIVLAVGYRAEVIEQHFGDGSDFGCRIRYLREDEPRGTGGPLRGLLDQGVPSDPVIVLNGDLVTSFSVSGLLSSHQGAAARLTVAVTDYVHEVPYGVFELADPEGRVTALREKPTWVGTVNAGVYVLQPDLIEEIPSGRPVPMTELIEHCLERGETVNAWRVVGEWHDVGQPKDLARARGQ